MGNACGPRRPREDELQLDPHGDNASRRASTEADEETLGGVDVNGAPLGKDGEDRPRRDREHRYSQNGSEVGSSQQGGIRRRHTESTTFDKEGHARDPYLSVGVGALALLLFAVLPLVLLATLSQGGGKVEGAAGVPPSPAPPPAWQIALREVEAQMSELRATSGQESDDDAPADTGDAEAAAMDGGTESAGGSADGATPTPTPTPASVGAGTDAGSGDVEPAPTEPDDGPDDAAAQEAAAAESSDATSGAAAEP